MPVETLRWEEGVLRLIDQRLLPEKLEYVECRNVEDVFNAIRSLQVRGAPAIGVTAAFGVVLAVKDAKDTQEILSAVDKACQYLSKSRPTAVNLFWALDRMKNLAYKNSSLSGGALKQLLEEEAQKIFEEDWQICSRIGANGASLIKDDMNIITHCNAGGLATTGYGTALAVLYKAWEEGKRFHVYVDETRPVLQGARLTAWELIRSGIPTTLICDNMAGYLMQQGKIDLAVVGADRIAANGDTANKIGTYSLACLANMHDVPFYIAAPTSTFDLTLPSGDSIPIEERDSEEIIYIGTSQIAPKDVKVYNPAFDVTPSKLISGIITEVGIACPPYEKSLREHWQVAQGGK